MSLKDFNKAIKSQIGTKEAVELDVPEPGIIVVADAKDRALYEQISNWMIYGLEPKSIAEALTLTLSRLEEIISEEAFETVYRSVKIQVAQQQMDTDNSWDSIEAIALENLKTSIQLRGTDPDLMLRVASMANKAQRRNRYADGPINQESGTRVILRLSQQFTKRYTEDSVKGVESKSGKEIEIVETREVSIDDARIPTQTEIRDIFGMGKNERLIEDSDDIVNDPFEPLDR